MEHSKTPWSHGYQGNDGEVIISDADNFMIAETFGGDGCYGDVALKDARRIVACINACEGIETEALEDAHILIQAASKNMAAAILAEKQRDQLAEALEGMLQIYGGALDYDYLPKSSVEMDCIGQARAALAAVNGE